MSSKRESAIESAVTKFAKELGILRRKFTVTAGDPDSIYLYRGRCMFIEFKQEGKVPSPMQRHRIKQLQEQGFFVPVIDSFTAGANALSIWKTNVDKEME